IADRGAPDDAVLAERDAFRKARGTLRHRVGDERGHLAVLHPSDVDAAMEAGIVAVLSRNIPRLRVGDVERVVQDAHTARAAELAPLGDERAARRQDLDPVVGAIADENAPLRIQRQRMWIVELSGAGTRRAERLNEGAVLREMNDAAI